MIKVPLPFGLGGFAIPVANLTPSNAVGTVRFMVNGHNIGGPVKVSGGVAVGPFEFLPPGQYSVTAVFTPTDSTKFKSSTSNPVKVTFGGDRGRDNGGGDNNAGGNNAGGNNAGGNNAGGNNAGGNHAGGNH